MEIHGSLTNFCSAFGCQEGTSPEAVSYFYFYSIAVLQLLLAGILLGVGFCSSVYLITWVVWKCGNKRVRAVTVRRRVLTPNIVTEEEESDY